ncbi:hypothetical protein IA69_19895 [Massilia sp. JS1662]|nr:DoxX family protein [Massilia sp. JS1662]KGF80256.1 hypothetical protein IA69_19895 [Massilia sp. JS1662]
MAAKKTVGLPADDAGRFILRVVLGVLILFLGLSKVVGGIGAVAGLLAGHGLPHWFGYLVYVGEVVAPMLVVAAIWTRPAALVVAINMVAVLAAALAVAMLGAGRYSVGGPNGRLN